MVQMAIEYEDVMIRFCPTVSPAGNQRISLSHLGSPKSF